MNIQQNDIIVISDNRDKRYTASLTSDTTMDLIPLNHRDRILKVQIEKAVTGMPTVTAEVPKDVAPSTKAEKTLSKPKSKNAR